VAKGSGIKVSREVSLRINNFLDRFVPPALRDSRLFGWAARRIYGPLTIDIVEFKDRAFYLSRDEFSGFYKQLWHRFSQGETDLTARSLRGVVAAVRGRRILDIACGDGLVAHELAPGRELVVGADVATHAGRRGRSATVRWAAANVEELPFRDDAFDTVVSTHTLEHVQHLETAFRELRRVAHHRLVVVVPRQRPYRATFNSHIHFFPYRFSLLAWTGTDRPHVLDLVGGDWLYVEDQPTTNRLRGPNG
jgi:ubiquinone/menaquinone biosynthesis C-methylase UbiE